MSSKERCAIPPTWDASTSAACRSGSTKGACRSTAVMQLFASRDEEKKWARAIAMMRNGFGGHPYGPSQPIAEERRRGQVGGACWDSD